MPARASLRRTMTLAIGVPLVVTGIAVAFIQYRRDFDREVASRENAIALTVDAAGDSLDEPFSRAEQAVWSALAVVASEATDDGLEVGGEPNAEQLNALLASELRQDFFIFGACVALWPGEQVSAAADGQPATVQVPRFCTYVCRDVVEPAERASSGAGIPPAAKRNLRRMDLAADPEYDYEHQPWFLEATRNGAWIGPYFDEGGGDILMATYSLEFGHGRAEGHVPPVRVRRGMARAAGGGDASRLLMERLRLSGDLVRGVMTCDVAIADLVRELVNEQPDPNIRLAVFRPNGELIASSQARGDAPTGPAVSTKSADEAGAAVAAFIAGGPDRAAVQGDFDRNGTLEDVRMCFTRMQTTGWVVVGYFREDMVIPQVVNSLIGGQSVTLAGVGLVLVVVILASRRIAAPLEAMAKSVGALGAGDLSVRAPVTARQDEIGLLSRAFNDAMTRLAGAMSAREAEAEARGAVEAEIHAAREMQANLLPDLEAPRGSPRDPLQGADRLDWEFAGVNIPARGVAGDFYDLVPLPGGRFGFVVADVCGKGAGAAMMMAVSKTLLRSALVQGRTPGKALESMNSALIAQGGESRFVTVFVAEIDPKSGRFEWASGGHPPVMVINCAGQVRALGESTGTVVGLLPGESWGTEVAQLNSGEFLLAYTDGVTEARGEGMDEEFGDERLRTAAQGQWLSAVALCAAVAAAARRFTASEALADDLTVFAIRAP